MLMMMLCIVSQDCIAAGGMAMDDDLWSHGKRAGEMGLGDVDGEGEGSWKLPWRNREREKRRLQVKMFQIVVSRIPTQPGARVRATQEGVSCLTSRLEPTSIDGRPAEMPSRVCPVAGGAGCLDISRAVPSPSQFNCLGRGYAFSCRRCLSFLLTRTNKTRRTGKECVVNVAFHRAQSRL